MNGYDKHDAVYEAVEKALSSFSRHPHRQQFLDSRIDMDYGIDAVMLRTVLMDVQKSLFSKAPSYSFTFDGSFVGANLSSTVRKLIENIVSNTGDPSAFRQP